MSILCNLKISDDINDIEKVESPSKLVLCVSRKMSDAVHELVQLAEFQRCVEMQWIVQDNVFLVMRYKYGTGIDFRIFCTSSDSGTELVLQDAFQTDVMLVVNRFGSADKTQRGVVSHLIDPLSRLVNFMHSQQKYKNTKYSYSNYRSNPLPPVYCEWESSTDVVLYSSLDTMGYIGNTRMLRVEELLDALTCAVDEFSSSLVVGEPVRVVQLKEVDTKRVVFAPVDSSNIEDFKRPSSLAGKFTWSINDHSTVYDI
jgi:hypothetical protein